MGIQFRTLSKNKNLEGDLVFECQSKRRSTKEMPFLIWNLEALHQSFLNALKSKRNDGMVTFFYLLANGGDF